LASNNDSITSLALPILQEKKQIVSLGSKVNSTLILSFLFAELLEKQSKAKKSKEKQSKAKTLNDDIFLD
jgi:hypothetical protein